MSVGVKVLNISGKKLIKFFVIKTSKRFILVHGLQILYMCLFEITEILLRVTYNYILNPIIALYPGVSQQIIAELALQILQRLHYTFSSNDYLISHSIKVPVAIESFLF